MSEKNVDPREAVIAEFSGVEDEDLKAGKVPEAELNAEPPEDKEEPARDESGKFKSKDEKKADAEEKKPDEKAQKEPEKKASDVVPLATFLEEKNRLKAELEQRDITLAEFKKELAELKAKHEKTAEPEEPDYIDDPKAYVDHKLSSAIEKLDKYGKTAEEAGKKAEETARQAQAREQLQMFSQHIGRQEQQFVATNPDYYDALAHLREIRKFQLQSFHPQATEAQITQAISQEELNLAWQLAQQGKDPIAFTYDLAKRHGYAKKAPLPATTTTTADTSKRLPPDQSLGGGNGAPDLKDDDDGKPDAVDLALASIIRKRA